jgi:hypothetical protein
MFFQYLVSTQQVISVCSIFLHQVFCDFWIDCKFDIFGFRSTPLCSSFHDTLLINGFAGISCIHRWSSLLHPPPTHRRVAHTHLGEFLSFLRVVAPLASSAFLRQDLRWIQSALSFSTDERPLFSGTWFSLHFPLLLLFICCLCFLFMCLFLGFSVATSCLSLFL